MPPAVYPHVEGKTPEEVKQEFKTLKQYLRLREQFEKDNNVLIHFNHQGLIFGKLALPAETGLLAYSRGRTDA